MKVSEKIRTTRKLFIELNIDFDVHNLDLNDRGDLVHCLKSDVKEHQAFFKDLKQLCMKYPDIIKTVDV